MENKKVESTHGTPPAMGIESFRSTTTTCNIPLISIDIGVKGVLWTGMATDELIVEYAI